MATGAPLFCCRSRPTLERCLLRCGRSTLIRSGLLGGGRKNAAALWWSTWTSGVTQKCLCETAPESLTTIMPGVINFFVLWLSTALQYSLFRKRITAKIWQRENVNARWDTAVVMGELSGFHTFSVSGLAVWEALKSVS